MKKVIATIMCIVLCLSLTACNFDMRRLKTCMLSMNITDSKWETIDVEITEYDFHSWETDRLHKQCSINVCSKEYDIEESFVFVDDEANAFSECKIGDVIKGYLYMHINTETEQIDSREIKSITIPDT